MTRTLVRCGWIITLDDALGDRVSEDILIEDGRIVAVGRDLGPADTVIDGQDMIAIPGLVDAHLHSWETGLKAIGCDWRKGEYLRDVFAGLSTYFGPEDNYIATLAAGLSRIDSGVTTLLDYCHNIRSHEQAERSVDALVDSGVRAVFAMGTGVFRPDQNPPGPLAKRMLPREGVAALRERLSDDEALVTLCLAVPGPHWAEEETIRANLVLTRDFGLRSSSHATMRKSQELMPDGYRRLVAEGALGADHNIVHANYLPDDELKMLLDAGVTVTSSVQTEVRGYGLPPAVSRVWDFGFMPSLGVDVEPKVSGSMFAEMQLALAYVQNERVREDISTRSAVPPRPVTARDALRWATIGGAEALGIGHRVGTLTPGKQADIVLLRATDLNLWPVHNPVFSAVEFAHPGNVDTVLVGGKVVKRKGQLSVGEGKLRKMRDDLLASTERVLSAADYRIDGALRR
ncbi:amidohydrolase family protein [Pararhodobacter sp.]|uniref:amidohydrolase family protein n=1 Tax=Pararhodobacter sp. TaxID=2127056 RepID=UPI002FDDD4B2